MEVKINITDYLSPDDIKEECRLAVRNIIWQQFSQESQIERLISNLGYEFIFEAISRATGKDAREAIATKVAELANDSSHIRFEMWRRRDAWNRTESPAIGIMEQAIKDNRELIVACVRKQIEAFEFPDVREEMYKVATEVISDKLFGRED